VSNDVNVDSIVFDLLLAGGLTLVVGFIALVLMQRAILSNIAAVGEDQLSGPGPTPEPRRPASSRLTFAVEDATTRRATGVDRSILLRLALAHVASGLSFGIIAALLLLHLSDSGLDPLRIAVVAWAFAGPTILCLNLLIGPQRGLQFLIVLGYLGVLLVFGGFAVLGGTTGMPIGNWTLPAMLVPALVWAIYAAPSVFLLLFLNRTIRTIGPLVFVFMLVVLTGNHAALSLLEWQLTYQTTATTAANMLGGDALFWGVGALGLAAGAWPAWRSVVFLRDRYAAKRSSDLSLTVGTIWLFQSVILSFSLLRAAGAFGLMAAALPFLGWYLVLHVALRPVSAAAAKRPPTRLLLLRVFGFGRRSRRFLDLVGARWRLIGSIDLIAAPDLASRTVEPATFFEFVRGRLDRLFIRTPQDLAGRLDALDHRPDPDGRFRINQLFCADAMWRDAVTRLMTEASLVVMDLRGFGPQRRGCAFELQTLLDTVPLDRLVVLFDRTTDRRALDALLDERWHELDPASPNLGSAQPKLRLVDASAGDVRAVRRLLADATAQ
jgi:hypothetical protein